ncbi:uncharacterized protein LOC141721485 isoform X2 [Apium graveolens]|uniref:uncharacterized protein LOC141721485 isoform X2 n=1 Tax=Apium graveolens TaxID=4045 RepID=UPI003D7A3D17
MNNMVSDKAVDAVFRGFRYVFRYKSLEVQLNSETEKLKIEMNNMSNEVKKEKANGKIIKAHVSKWQKEVEEEIQKSATTELPPSSCNCIKSLPIPNPVSRFQRGRNAFKKATAVAQLTSTGKDHLTRDIADLSPFQNKPKPDTAYEEFESRKDVYKKLWDALVNEDSPLIHGIYGMAGVGKTRMMEKFWEDALKDKIFKDVVRVDVGSENIDNLKLQDQVAGLVNCNLESQDVNRRASQLESSIRNVGKILLILDDVWSEIPLDDIIGTPFGDGSSSKGSKILFTSRKEDVLKGNKCEHLVEINTLSPGEALNLFKNTVGADKINSLQDESLVQRVCDECGHLPLLIHAVGKALKDEPHNSWKDAHHQLETGKFQNIVGVEPKVYKCIKLSIDYLQHDDAKSCLFLCSFFPEDAIIDLKMLVQLATGSKLINPDGGESRVLNMVNSLKTSSLLLGSGPKVHDIIRDVARFMASTDPTYAFLHVKCNSQYFPSDAGCCTGKLLRLDMETSDVYFDEDMVCKDLHTLWLQSNNHPQKFSGGFFKMFAYLSSLMLQNVKISLEQFSLQDLGNLRTVTFLGCDISKTNASLFPAKLKSLWIYDCYLPRPLKVANLTCLQKLKIQNINLLVVPNFISTLSSLEELHIPEGFHIDGEEYQEEPIVMEISKLTHLRSLQFSFPVGSTFHGTNALSNYIVSYDILVGGPGGLIETPRQLSRGPLMRSIELIGNHWQFWEGLIAMAEEVRLQNSNVELSSIYIGHKGAFGDLKKLYIKKCHNMGNLASISQDEIQYSFQHEVTCFSKLTILDIESCSELKYLFCNNIAKSLVQLQKLRVFNCESMEAIIVNEGTSEGEIITFSNLKSLTIKGCPRLAGFYAQKKNAYSGSTSSMDPSAQYQPFLDREVRFPSLEELKIRSLPYTSVIWGKDCYNDKLRHLRVGKCDKLETVIPQAMMHKVHNLEQIHIYECSSLRTMFLPSVAIDLTHLKELTVKNCEKMTEIIEAGEQLITSDDMLFPELTILELVNLQSLTSVWCCQSGKANTCKVPFRLLQLSSIVLESLPALKSFLHGSNFEFHTPALKKVKVDSCVLSTLFTFSMFKKFQLKNLEVRNCELLENIVEDLRGDETCNKIITLSQLTEVALQNLPNLKSFFHNANYEFHMPVIKRVNVYYCGFSDTLFRRSVFKNLKQLKELCVLNCEMLESIFEDARADESADTSDKFITLNKVCTVDIQGLPKLKSIFFGATNQCYMPALKKVTISRCGLSALFTPSVFREFKQLENLNVSHCESLEHIVKEVGVDVTYEMNGKSIISHRLSFVSLEHLPNLKSCFHNANYEFHMPDLRKVKVDCCGLSNALFTRSVFNNLKRLGELSVLNCELLESICEDESPGTSDKIITLNRLSMVNFQGLPKVKSIFYGATFECHMPALDRINIVGCGLSVLFTSSVFREIQQLRKLNVSNCESLEHIVKEVGVDETFEINGKSIISHSLSFVSLEHLPNLKSCFHNANYEFHMPNLWVVKVDCCGLSNALFTRSVFNNLKLLTKLSVLNCELLESICEDESPGTSDKIITLNRLSMVNFQGLPKVKRIFYGATFECHMPTLRHVEIVGCGLSVLFTSSMFREIQKLIKLDVSDCESLENIVEEVEVDETSEIIDKSITFHGLGSITLKSLPNLKSFSSSLTYVFNMPQLRTFLLRECPRIEYFSFSRTNTSAVRVTIDGCIEEGIQDLNECIRQNHKRGSYSSHCTGESSYSSQQLGTQSERIEEKKASV